SSSCDILYQIRSVTRANSIPQGRQHLEGTPRYDILQKGRQMRAGGSTGVKAPLTGTNTLLLEHRGHLITAAAVTESFAQRVESAAQA
ncbi:hypothetical protein Nmel_018701, partial [Mimus melanotis]